MAPRVSVYGPGKDVLGLDEPPPRATRREACNAKNDELTENGEFRWSKYKDDTRSRALKVRKEVAKAAAKKRADKAAAEKEKNGTGGKMEATAGKKKATAGNTKTTAEKIKATAGKTKATAGTTALQTVSNQGKDKEAPKRGRGRQLQQSSAEQMQQTTINFPYNPGPSKVSRKRGRDDDQTECRPLQPITLGGDRGSPNAGLIGGQSPFKKHKSSLTQASARMGTTHDRHNNAVNDAQNPGLTNPLPRFAGGHECEDSEAEMTQEPTFLEAGASAPGIDGVGHVRRLSTSDQIPLDVYQKPKSDIEKFEIQKARE
ncbi:MAG: hypothetical protein Q9226_009150 [Calogaya cf. arnoldii]